jgi:hypothetical protein
MHLSALSVLLSGSGHFARAVKKSNLKSSVADPGSESGSICQRYESYHQAKIVRKTLFPIVVIFYDFLSLKNDVNVPSKSYKQKAFQEEFC